MGSRGRSLRMLAPLAAMLVSLGLGWWLLSAPVAPPPPRLPFGQARPTPAPTAAPTRIPDGFPADFPLYPGGVLSVDSASYDGKARGDFVLYLGVDDSPDQVLAFYRQKLQAAPYQVLKTPMSGVAFRRTATPQPNVGSVSAGQLTVILPSPPPLLGKHPTLVEIHFAFAPDLA